MKDFENSLEICKLEINSPSPHLKTLCHLEFPPLTEGINFASCGACTEWVPTSKDYAQYRSSRGFHSPFYSSTVRTLGLRLSYSNQERDIPPYTCSMIINLADLLSAIPTDLCNVPWTDWGPSNTHIFEGWLQPAGPFWITDISPLVVRRYDLPSTWPTPYTQSMAMDTSSLQPEPPVRSSTEVSCSFWKAGKVKTNLPYHDVVVHSIQVDNHIGFMVADREWLVWGIWGTRVRRFCA
jgi:hypothetical protein